MLLGTLVGVMVIPGLYYMFARLSDGQKLLRDETATPFSEQWEGEPLPPDEDSPEELAVNEKPALSAKSPEEQSRED